MKASLQFSLLALLSTVILANPIHLASNIQSQEQSNDLEPLGKRATTGAPQCDSFCGNPSSSNCVLQLEAQASDPPGNQVCSTESGVVFQTGIECQATFSGHNASTVCITQAQIVTLVTQVFDTCVNNPNIATGGCVTLENGSRVCLRDENAATCF